MCCLCSHLAHILFQLQLSAYRLSGLSHSLWLFWDMVSSGSAQDRKAMWTTARQGTLAPIEQAKVWGIKWACEKFGKKCGFKVPQEDIAASVRKVGGGHPNQGAISKLMAAMDDPDWYPGKEADDACKPGPKPLFTAQMQQAVANSAMALKRRGEEPSATEVKARCPEASTNPDTGDPFTDKYIHRVFSSRCFDDGAEEPWTQKGPYAKTALSPPMMTLRLAWGRAQERLGHDGAWFLRHVIFVDPCHTILSNKPRTAFDEHQASFGKGKRWMSPDTSSQSRNLRASPYATKQCQAGDRKVWWFIVMVRGHVHHEVMGRDWVQGGAGMAEFVSRLDAICHRYVGKGDKLPRVVFSDRGPGFYQSSTGHIVGEYFNALRKHGYRAYAGSDASKQPPDMPDLFPHETAVAWTRTYMKKHPRPKASLDEMEADLRATLVKCAKHINENYDVEGLHKSLPDRIAKMIQLRGDRLVQH